MAMGSIGDLLSEASAMVISDRVETLTDGD